MSKTRSTKERAPVPGARSFVAKQADRGATGVGLSRLRLVFSVDEPGPDARIGAPFGRCKAFVIADVETGQLQIVPNPAAGQEADAGEAASSFIIRQGVDAVIAGAFGHKAPQILAGAGIATYRLTSGSVRDFVNRLRDPAST